MTCWLITDHHTDQIAYSDKMKEWRSQHTTKRREGEIETKEDAAAVAVVAVEAAVVDAAAVAMGMDSNHSRNKDKTASITVIM